MHINQKKRIGVLLSSVLGVTLFLSSCNFVQDTAPDDIKKVVKNYLTEIEEGDFADNDYESDYAEDTPFEDIQFSDESAKNAMDIGLTKFSYDIKSVTGSTAQGEGSCKVEIEALDVKEIVKDLEEEIMTYEAFEKAISSKKAKKDDTTITLVLEYSASDKSWTISETEDIFDIFAEPYTKLSFAPKAGDPMVVVDSYFKFLADADYDSLKEIYADYDVTKNEEEDENKKQISKLFYLSLTYKLVSEPVIDDDTCEIALSIEHMELSAIGNRYFQDKDALVDLLKVYILGLINNEDSQTEVTQLYIDAFFEELKNPDAERKTTEVTISLVTSEDGESWLIDYIPDSLFVFDTVETPSEDMYNECLLLAIDELLADGDIDQKTYDLLYVTLTGHELPEPDNVPAVTYGTGEYVDDIVLADWYDYLTEDYCTTYDSKTMIAMEFEVRFATYHEGLGIGYKYYTSDGTEIASMIYTIASNDNSAYLRIEPEEEAGFRPDTYLIRVFLEDGTFLCESSIVVY